MVIIMKGLTTFVAGVLLASTTVSAATEKLSFPHAAELTAQAKQIVFQEVNEHRIPNYYHQSMMCLAENIYFEARAEGMDGKAAVANVTRNRVESSLFPNTYCGVVYQGPVRESWKTKQTPDPDDAVYYPRKHKCQFSWYCDGKKDVIWANYERTGAEIKLNAQAWRQSVEIAIWTLGFGSYTVNDNTGGATYYYAHNLVYPHWAEAFRVTEVIGNHTFMSPN